MVELNRRFMLKTMAAGVGLAMSPLTIGSNARPLPAGKQATTFIQHNDLPWALETSRSSFGFGPITPASHFFVRNNLPMPPAAIVEDPDAWEFAVEGCARAGSLKLAELKRMNVQSVAAVIQCSGNGRAFFSHRPSGSNWSVGAAGCALWTGVSVADVFEQFGGVEAERAFLTATGGETLPDGVDKDTVAVERSVPIDKGLQDCMLVWEMNGAPLPLAHGGPVRLLVPGYFGVNNVKWVKCLAATRQQSGAKIQQSGYRLRAIGENGGPQHPSMWRMPVKSWINGPGAEGIPVLAGKNTLYGVAFSGERGIDRVEISGDNGETWQAAELVGPDLGPNAWRTFRLHLDMAIGEQRFFSRATDTAGDRQPRQARANQRGYGHNGWQDHGLAIKTVKTLPIRSTLPAQEAAAPAAVVANKPRELSAAAEAGRKVFQQQAVPACSVCHTLAAADASGAIGPNLNTLQPGLAQVRNAVTQGVGAMPAYGHQLSASEIDALAAFVHEAAQQ